MPQSNKVPRLIFWETTQVCNLGCSHCRASAKSVSSRSELTTEEAKAFIDQVAGFSKPVLVFSGGEPLVREDIFELIQYAASSGLKPALATNATLITPKVASLLKESGIEIVAVSIYGPDEDSHDEFCGKKGAFQKSLEGINCLKRAGIKFQINTTITKKNISYLEDIGDFAASVGADSYHIFFLVPTGRGKYIAEDELTPQEYEDAFNRVYDLTKHISLRIKPTCAPHYYRVLRQRIASEKVETLSKDTHSEDSLKGCLAGQKVCFVSHEGEVFGCGYLPISTGSVKEKDFKDIWFNSLLFCKMRDASKLEGKCGVCEFKNVCGGCRARAYATEGNYLGEDPECIYHPLTEKY
ncbi:MAG: radical SAM protein [Candidatus Omnitrophota bacterium]|nr:radical SAM protein [Candidatus Omnitrophota bacterium]